MVDKELSESQIVNELGLQTAKTIVDASIAALQEIKANLSGDDSNLANVWEEICVQRQGEESFDWDVYEDFATSILESEVRSLPEYELDALWMRTDAYWDWEESDPGSREPYPVSVDDVVEYLLKERLMNVAGYWSNERISNFLEQQDDDWESEDEDEDEDDENENYEEDDDYYENEAYEK